MPTTRCTTEPIVNLLREQKIATMPELMAVLGAVERTVFRKLKELPYHASYSHRGRYYTLTEVADFDSLGLWSYKSVRFSLRGTLQATVEAIVNGSERGHFVDELDSALHVATKDVLRKLTTDGRLSRENVGEHYLYCSAEPAAMRRQMAARRSYRESPSAGDPLGRNRYAVAGDGVGVVPEA